MTDSSKIIYVDNAATTELDREAFEAMLPFLRESWANASQPYTFALSARKALKGARETIAACIGSKSDEIYFTSGGTESDNHALKLGCRLKQGRRGEQCEIVTSPAEHHAVLNSCAALKRDGLAQVRYAPVTKEGVVTPDALEGTISPSTTLVSLMTANNEIGSLAPIAQLTELSHEAGALFHTDAVAAVGHVSINVSELGVDMLSASSHKFNGPKGVGFLYVRRGTPLLPFMDGGSQEAGLRAGTENTACIVGMAAALKNNVAHLEQNQKHLQELEKLLVARLRSAAVDFIQNGSEAHKVAGNVSLSFAHSSGETLLHRLDLKGICVSTGSACDGHTSRTSHVIQAIGTPPKYASGTIRISLGKYNTADEVERIAEELIHILR